MIIQNMHVESPRQLLWMKKMLRVFFIGLCCLMSLFSTNGAAQGGPLKSSGFTEAQNTAS